MSVDLVFRVGPTKLYALSGSSDTGSRQLRFNTINLQTSQFIDGPRNLIFSSGKLSFRSIQQATVLTPSGKGRDYPLEGQGFTSGSSNQLFPKYYLRR